MRKATIGIDCRLGGVRHGGIGRYIAEYLHSVVRLSDHNFSLVFSDLEQQRELLDAVTTVHRSRIQTTIADVRHYSVAEQLQLPALFNSLPIDVLHVPHFNVPLGYRRPFVVTIHDLLWHTTTGTTVTTLPTWQYWLKYAGYRVIVSNAINRAKKIFTPTQFVADSIGEHYSQALDKMVVTYEGASSIFVPAAQVKRNNKQLLYVGSLYPHKNVRVILDALIDLPEYSLQIVGARDAFTESFKKEVHQLGLDARVSIKTKVSDRELVTLYQQAAALIQPSTSEGFGLTGIEALACGTPLLASDIAVFHEVYQEAALFFNPKDPHSLVDALDQLPNTDTLRHRGSVKEALTQCSWDGMTQRILTSIESTL
ncbi:glycosyltransferase family 4 protein [Candidatus Woesebacteria bacterium]|nr:glycosyltransferase family 4 protein [Candidatus Woesebacteria bacterium]